MPSSPRPEREVQKKGFTSKERGGQITGVRGRPVNVFSQQKVSRRDRKLFSERKRIQR